MRNDDRWPVFPRISSCTFSASSITRSIYLMQSSRGVGTLSLSKTIRKTPRSLLLLPFCHVHFSNALCASSSISSLLFLTVLSRFLSSSFSVLLPSVFLPFSLYRRVHRVFPSVCRRRKVSLGGTLPSSFRDVSLNNSIRVWVISKGCSSVDSSAR